MRGVVAIAVFHASRGQDEVDVVVQFGVKARPFGVGGKCRLRVRPQRCHFPGEFLLHRIQLRHDRVVRRTFEMREEVGQFKGVRCFEREAGRLQDKT